MGLALQILLALVVANFYEWILHRFVLHKLGKRKASPFHFHWTHHRNVRISGGHDPIYKNLLPLSREAIVLLFFFILHTPLFWYYPVVAGTLGLYGLSYYFLHRKAHLDVKWGKRWLPWHYDHHLGKNQDLNWCVLFPMWDYILGTRKKFF